MQQRRTFLRTTAGTAAALTGVSGLVTATVPDEDWDRGAELGSKARERAPAQSVYEQSLRLRRQADWDVHKWRSWLAKRGFEFRHSDKTTSPTAGEVSSQKLSESDVTLYLTYTRGRDTDYINVEWKLKDGWLTYAEPPRDFVSISFDSQYYNFTEGTKMKFGPETRAAEEIDALGHNYRVASYNDDGHAFWTTGSFGSWFDAKLYPTGGSKYTRQIYMDYIHRWDDVSPTGTSIDSSGSVSITFSSSTGLWRAETFAAEYQMENGDTYADSDPE